MIVNKYNQGGGGSGSGVTPQEVQQQINSALTPYWDSAVTESAITEAVSGKADAKILVDFDHTSQAERAALYADLYDLYDGGSGATINRNYDFFKTVNTWQGLKIDYYGFSGDTLVFGKVVSPENMEDQVVYEQVMTIDSEGNVEVVTNIVGGASGGTGDTEILKASNYAAAELETGDVIASYNVSMRDQYYFSYTISNTAPSQSEKTISEDGLMPDFDYYGGVLDFPSWREFFSAHTQDNPVNIGQVGVYGEEGNNFWARVVGYYDVLVYQSASGSASADGTIYPIVEFKAASGASATTDYIFAFSGNGAANTEIMDCGYFYLGFQGAEVNQYGNRNFDFKIGIGNNFAENKGIKILRPRFMDANGETVRGLQIKMSGSSIMTTLIDSRDRGRIGSLEAKFKQYTPTSGFSTINGSAITEGGNIVIQGGSGGDADLTPAFPRMPHLVLDDGSLGDTTLIAANIKSALFDDSQDGPVSTLRLASSNFSFLDENIDWGEADIYPFLTIDTQNLVAYIENIPAGEYTFMLSKFQAGENYDSAFTAHYFSKEGSDWSVTTIETTSEIWNNPDVDLDQYWRAVAGDGSEIAVVKADPWGPVNLIWSFPKDVARFEIRVVDDGEGNESVEVNITYKEDEISGITGDIATLSAVVQDQQVVFSSGYNELHTQVMELSARTSPDVSNFVTSAQVETQITDKNYVTSADVKTQVEEYHYVVSGDVKSQVEAYEYVNSGQVETQILAKNYITAEDIEPDVIYEAEGNDPGFYAINSSALTTWQIENLDLSPYQFVRFYIKASDINFNSSDNFTAPMYVDVVLDPKSLSSEYQAYLGVTTNICAGNRNRSFHTVAAVDITKSKVQLLYETSLWDISVSSAANNGRYCYKIEGYRYNVCGTGDNGGGGSYTAGPNIDISPAGVISVSGLSTINGSAITEGGNIVIEGGSSDTEILKSYTGSYSELEEGDLTTRYSPTVCERLGMTYNGFEAEPQYSDRSGYTIQFPNIYSGSYAEFTEESPATLGTIYLTKEGSRPAYDVLFYHDSSDNFCVKIKETDGETEYVFNLSAGTPYQYVFEDYTEFYMGYYKRSPSNPIAGNFLIGFQSPYDMPGKRYISVGVSNVGVEMKVGVGDQKTLIRLGDIERIDRNTAQIQNAIHSLSSRTGNFITSGQADTQITNKLADYTPTSGFSTINGSAITNGGNIVIQGGGGGGGISQADLASSGYLYFNHDGVGNTETNLDAAYDFLKGNDGDGYSVDPPQLVDYDAYDNGSAGTPPFPKHIVTIYRSDYDDLVNNGNEDGETFYIVLPDPGI